MLGDPLRAAMAAYLNDETDGDFENRFADQADVRVSTRVWPRMPWVRRRWTAPSGAPSIQPTTRRISGLTDDQDFSSPDGLVFTPSTGICWIQTDDGLYTDVTNCMMHAVLPRQAGDGGALSALATGVETRMGALLWRHASS